MRLLKCARCGAMKGAEAFTVHRGRTCSTCLSKPKLNQAQAIALVLLVENEEDGGRPFQTSNRNRGRSIAFRTASHLEKLGLVRIRGSLTPSGAFYEVLLTDEGRALVDGGSVSSS